MEKNQWREVSGELTDEQRELGWPAGTLSAHTEVKAISRILLKPGDRLTLKGEKPPCPSCRSVMNQVAAHTGAEITYQWHERQIRKIWRSKKSSST